MNYVSVVWDVQAAAAEAPELSGQRASERATLADSAELGWRWSRQMRESRTSAGAASVGLTKSPPPDFSQSKPRCSGEPHAAFSS